MIIGFIGSRYGMTLEQKKVVLDLLTRFEAKEVHHGDCVGADRQFHDMVIELDMTIVVHPPSNQRLRAYCIGDSDRVRVLPQRAYPERNLDFVEESDILIATSKSSAWIPRSRTWYTIGVATMRGKVVHVVYPNGEVEIVSRKSTNG